MRLQEYSCSLPQIQGSVEYNMLRHGRGCTSDNTDSNQEHLTEEDTGLLSSRRQKCIMAEWKRCIYKLLQYSKAPTISLKELTVSAHKHFNPSSPYNICLSTEEIPPFRMLSYESRVQIPLPEKLCDDNNWRGLVICTAFEVHDQLPFVSMVKLLCHLRSKDYCLNPIPMCSITKEKLLSDVYVGGFIWLTYIPRALLSEFSVVSHVKARIYKNCPALSVKECGIRLLYRKDEKEFKRVVTMDKL